MIHPANIIVQAPGQNRPGQLAAAAPSRARAVSPPEREPAKPIDATPDAVGWTNRSVANQFSTVANANFTAALSPIEDKAMAAAATQNARDLILKQPNVAMMAQANADSQSAQRLLQ